MSDKWIKRSEATEKKRCGECCHFSACAQWNVGNIAFMEATNCKNYDKATAIQIILPTINSKPHIAVIPQSEIETYKCNCQICDSGGGEDDEI